MISVVICAYNPKEKIFDQVLKSLQKQTLDFDLWEIIVIDNASKIPIKDNFDISWHPKSKIIIETQPGLSHARLKGVKESINPLIVFVDDDNVLDSSYLATALKFYQEYSYVGCFGGKSLPVFESPPPDWFFTSGINLGCQDFGDDLYISSYSTVNFSITNYPNFAPIGTGMVVQKEAFLVYIDEVKNSEERLALGRKGTSLTSGEDNDIILTIIKRGYEIAYVPGLVVKHLIPENRYSLNYLKKMAYESERSWIKVLNIHNIRPWRPIPSYTLALRLLRLWLIIKPWLSPARAIRWQGASGKLKSLAEIE